MRYAARSGRLCDGERVEGPRSGGRGTPSVGAIYGSDFSCASTFGVSERKTVLWTVFREAVLPKARSTGRAAKRTTCTTMRRRARWGTAAAVEGASVNGLRGAPSVTASRDTSPVGEAGERRPPGELHTALRADYIPFCERITYHAYAWITYRASRGFGTADYILPCGRITYRSANGLHTTLTRGLHTTLTRGLHAALRADYIPRFARIWNGGLYTAVRFARFPLRQRPCLFRVAQGLRDPRATYRAEHIAPPRPRRGGISRGAPKARSISRNRALGTVAYPYR